MKELPAPASPPPESSVVEMPPWKCFVVSIIVLFFVLQLNLTKSALSLMTCTTVAGRRMLAGDLQFDCDDPANHGWMYGAGIVCLFAYAFGVSLVTGLALFLNRKKLKEPETRALFGFLFSTYRDEYYYWEIVIQFRKIAMAFIGVLLRPSGIGTQATFATTLMVASSMAHNAALPFRSSILNHFENASIVVTLVTLNGGSTLIDPRASPTWKSMISVLIVVFNMAYFGAIFYILLRLFCSDASTQAALAEALGRVSERMKGKAPGQKDAVDEEETGDGPSAKRKAAPSAFSSLFSTLSLRKKPLHSGSSPAQAKPQQHESASVQATASQARDPKHAAELSKMFMRRPSMARRRSSSSFSPGPARTSKGKEEKATAASQATPARQSASSESGQGTRGKPAIALK